MASKATKNGFFYFMLEYRDEHPEKKFPNMKVLADAAGPSWQKLSKENRKPYEEKARACRHANKGKKYTTTGVDIEIIERRENEATIKEQKMKNYIEDSIATAAAARRLGDEVFYIVHVNYFCRTNFNERYYPAEIGMVRFSLRNGVIPENIFHFLIKPGPLPLGYLSEAAKLSKDTHQIPPPMESENENNMTQLLNQLMNFMTSVHGNPKNFPPIYALKKNCGIVENVLDNLFYDSGYETSPFLIYQLEYLFYILRNSVAGKPVWYITQTMLTFDKDVYDFTQNIACSYHINSEVPNHCSQSYATRLAYIICDNCCGDLNIRLIPGQHVPNNARIASQDSERLDEAASQASYIETEYEYAESDLSNVYQQDELGAVGGYDSEFNQYNSTMPRYTEYESDVNQDTASGWSKPVAARKKKGKSSPSECFSLTGSHNDSEVYFTDASETTQTSKKSVRRPNNLSAALGNLTISDGITSERSHRSRGRGKGIGANFKY